MSTEYAAEKGKFLILYGSYSRAYERFLENGFKALATFLVVLGWLLSSDTAQKFLAANAAMRWGAIALIVLAALFVVSTFRHVSRLSMSLRSKLDELAFLEPSFYEQYRITRLIYWSVVGQNLLLCLFAVCVLLSLP